MAPIIRVKSAGRFPKKPKGSPRPSPRSSGSSADQRGLGTGNNRFTKKNNWRPGEKIKAR